MRVPLISGIAEVIRYRSSRKPRKFKPHTYTTDRSFYDQFTIAEDGESITPAMQGYHLLPSSSVADVSAAVDASGAVPGADAGSECIGPSPDALTHSIFRDGSGFNRETTELGPTRGGSVTTSSSRNAIEPKVPNFSFPLPLGGQGCGASTGIDLGAMEQGGQAPVEVAPFKLDTLVLATDQESAEVNKKPAYTGGYSPFAPPAENVGESSAHSAVLRKLSTPYALTPGLMAMLQPDPPKSKSFRKTMTDFFRLKRFRRHRFRRSMVISAPQMGTPPPGDDFARFIREAGAGPEGGPIRVMFPMLVGSYHGPGGSTQTEGVLPEQAEAAEAFGEGTCGLGAGPVDPSSSADPPEPVDHADSLSPTGYLDPTDYFDYIAGCESNEEAQPLLGYLREHCASFSAPDSSSVNTINKSYATALATEPEAPAAITTTTGHARIPSNPPVLPDMEFQCNRRSGRTLAISMGFDDFPQFLAAEHAREPPGRACV